MIDLKALAADDEIREHLGLHCEFAFDEDRNHTAWFSIDDADTFQVIGRDGGGGLFLTVPPSPQVLFVSSEGAAGVVADDVDTLLTLMVWCPYWRDVLKFSADGQIEKMRRAAQALEDSWAEDDEFTSARKLLVGKLGLPEPEDPIGLLHRTITSSRAVLRARDGWVLQPLFGSFTIDDTCLRKACED
jgi:hypothetical protein